MQTQSQGQLHSNTSQSGCSPQVLPTQKFQNCLHKRVDTGGDLGNSAKRAHRDCGLGERTVMGIAPSLSPSGPPVLITIENAERAFFAAS